MYSNFFTNMCNIYRIYIAGQSTVSFIKRLDEWKKKEREKKIIKIKKIWKIERTTSKFSEKSKASYSVGNTFRRSAVASVCRVHLSCSSFSSNALCTNVSSGRAFNILYPRCVDFGLNYFSAFRAHKCSFQNVLSFLIV